MTLAEIVFTSKKLAEKYGVGGKVAAKYVAAGYSVKMEFPTAHGTVSFVAKKGSTVLAVDVVDGSRVVDEGVVRAIVEKAKSIRAKPVLVLYGSGPRLSEEAKKAAAELGVSVRRVRP